MSDAESKARSESWRERPTQSNVRAMSDNDVQQLKNNLVKSYKCAATDISYYCKPIDDKDDPDFTTSTILVFKMKCVVSGKLVDRDIFTVKILMPEELQRKRAEAITAAAPVKPPAVRVPIQLKNARRGT